MGLEADTCDCGACETLYRLLPEVGPVTMFDELIDLLDLVGSRDCIHADWAFARTAELCQDDACEPCTARRLYARMTAAKARVSPQDDAVRTR